MAKACEPPAVKLICGMISFNQDLFVAAQEELEKMLGPVDLASDVLDFDFTHYYDQEMGSPLFRRFVSFTRLSAGNALSGIKRATNELEERFSSSYLAGPKRPINLDPGYIELSKLVLASMKNFSHRIYLEGGVFGEITLQFRKGLWQPLPWSFPDYASGRYNPFLTAARERLRQQTECGDGE